jgi:two-component SAPR family response regulator
MLPNVILIRYEYEYCSLKNLLGKFDYFCEQKFKWLEVLKEYFVSTFNYLCD